MRDVLLSTATPRPPDQVLLAEILALRTIVLNLHFALAAGETATADAMRRLIERADEDKKFLVARLQSDIVDGRYIAELLGYVLHK